MEPMGHTNTPYENDDRSSNGRSIWTPILGAGLAVVGGFGLYQHSQTQDLRSELAAQRKIVLQSSAENTASDADIRNRIAALREDVEATSSSTKQSLTAAQVAARRQASKLVAEVEKKQLERAEAEAAKLNEEFTKLRTETETANAKIASVGTEVGAVQTQVGEVKSTLDKTLAEMQQTRGDLGVMSGLIATNSKEIQALRELGDRNIYEFTLAKKGNPQRVGDIQLRLAKTDVKKSRYTMTVIADDKSIEKKDKTSNEPVQFYVASKARQPYEIVVNEVTKDGVKGYLSTPKVVNARN